MRIKMGKGKKIAIGAGIAVVAFFAFVIIVAAFSQQPQSDSVASTQITNQESSDSSSIIQAANEASQNTSAQPQSVRVDDLSYKIINATQEGRRITVIVNVENHGQRIETISWLDFRLIDGNKNLYEDARPFPPDQGPLAAMGEIAPSADRDFKYVFVIPEGTQMTDYRLVVLEDSNNPRYLDLN